MAVAEEIEIRPRVLSDERESLESAVVRFAGDSGDGMQVTGGQFTLATAFSRNDLATFPDFPAEIRAPAGTTFGVSAFQINFGSRKIRTIGDAPDVLVALNPAALKVNLTELPRGAVVILDGGSFGDRNLKKAGFAVDPREDGSLDSFRVIDLDISKLVKEALAESGLSSREQLRSKNFYALGFVYWMFDRPRQPTADWLSAKFKDRPKIAEANINALNAGHALAETAEFGPLPAFRINQAPMPPGLYRTVTGHGALAFGLVDGVQKAGLDMVFCSYPITPASALLHNLARLRSFGVTTFQAEDEIAAVCAAIGASYAGSLGITSSSGPGIALKTEAIGLAIAIEVPLVIVNSQRAGPSTGMPTKTEQSDLYQAVYGRNADSPLVVLAASSPANCFEMAREAVRIAVHHMTPVMLLTDGFLANASEPWLIPDIDETPDFPVQFRTDPEEFEPFRRNENGVRPWVKPGTPGLMHRIGGIERDQLTGNISYDPDNHQVMTDARFAKIAAVADDIPLQEIEQGNESGQLAIVGWGSTYGPIARAVTTERARGRDVSHIHLRHIWPLPRNLGDLLKGFDHVLVPEMNKGQLNTVLRSEYLVPAEGLSKVTGKPFSVLEIEAAIDRLLDADAGGLE
ncbi:MAG: 2-oxoacid:acceptor oxidoreductase subunit alpha [Pseudomonadota bacterium]